MKPRKLNIYAPVTRHDVPRGAAVVGMPDPSGKVVAAIDIQGKRFRNRVTRAAITFGRARGAKLALRRFHPSQLMLVATISTDDWRLAEILDRDQLEVWAQEHLGGSAANASSYAMASDRGAET